jgi:hypothetical protein
MSSSAEQQVQASNRGLTSSMSPIPTTASSTPCQVAKMASKNGLERALPHYYQLNHGWWGLGASRGFERPCIADPPLPHPITCTHTPSMATPSRPHRVGATLVLPAAMCHRQGSAPEAPTDLCLISSSRAWGAASSPSARTRECHAGRSLLRPPCQVKLRWCARSASGQARPRNCCMVRSDHRAPHSCRYRYWASCGACAACMWNSCSMR